MSEDERESMLTFIVSDHCLSKTDTHISLVNMCKDEGYNPIFYPKIYKQGFDIAILESGNAAAFITYSVSQIVQPR